MIAVAAGHEEAPSFRSGGGGKHQDRGAVRELELDVAALCLLCAGHDKSIAGIYPRARVFVAVEQAAPFLILQAEAVLMRPSGRTLARPGIIPKVVTPRDRAVRAVEAPRTLDVQGVSADAARPAGSTRTSPK